MQIRIKRGLDLPCAGEPEQNIDDGPAISKVAALGTDYLGLKPTMHVQVGDRVRLGQVLFTDKRHPEVKYTAPGAGEIVDIVRGARRVLQSVIIKLEGDEQETFGEYARADLAGLDRAVVRDNLLNSGLWTALRTRPYSKVPDPAATPDALFVTAVDTAPLAANPALVVAAANDDFNDGLATLSRLTDGKVYVCTATDFAAQLPRDDAFQRVDFSGPHPAGLVGTHIHHLHPVSQQRSVWHLNYQDVIAVGRLFTTGRLDPTRILALGGPLVHQPRLLRTRLGASTEDLVRDQVQHIDSRVISGSPLAGHRATDWAAYVGRYHLQISVLAEGRTREFLGWVKPWGEKFSLTRTLTTAWKSGRRFAFHTSQYGSPRAMVPIGVYELVMPLDMLATPLLRALLVQDTELAQKLGCLELDEDDLALCTFVCPSKYEYGPALRSNLDIIEREG
jgi:Na+-transporting NADH:ubiquinone oxidoreductase subunit A